jgi:cytochrome c oxidase accessory protein FixG
MSEPMTRSDGVEQAEPQCAGKPALAGGACKSPCGGGGATGKACGGSGKCAAHEAPVLATLNKDGSRRWINPKPSDGRYARARRAVGYGLIALFVALPWVKINGLQAVQLDLATRRFDILGHRFLPTDTVLLALLGLSVFVGLFLLTALLGRVWCGWGCPQTVYMELVFRPIERLLEGTPGRRATGWLKTSGAGRVLKYAIFVVLSFALANTFLAYFVGKPTLLTWLTQSPLEHFGPFTVVLVTTGLMLFNFGFFREQMCLVACPYGRFQSALLDKQSLIVAYDQARGEPRGRAARGATLPVLAGTSPALNKRGDCVDCGACVATCPTGIDIRKGLQMECINCAQCIDACDAVMTKLGRPTGLIGYYSQDRIEGRPPRVFRPRVLIYPAILTVLVTAFVLVLVNQSPSYIRLIRGMGRPYTQMDDGSIANPIKLHVINRHASAVAYDVQTLDGRSSVRLVDADTPGGTAGTGALTLAPGESRSLTGFLSVPASAFVGGKYAASLRISDSSGFSRQFFFHMTGPASTTLPGGSGGAGVKLEAGERGVEAQGLGPGVGSTSTKGAV